MSLVFAGLRTGTVFGERALEWRVRGVAPVARDALPHDVPVILRASEMAPS